MISGCFLRTQTFLSLGDAPDKVSENALIVIEMFVVLIYGRTNEFCRVNSATQHLFSWKSCFLESILPRQSALVQQLLGIAYQGGHIWGQAKQRDPKLPSPAYWGWKKSFDMDNLIGQIWHELQTHSLQV